MTIEKLSAPLSAFVVAAAAFIAVLGINVSQEYSDFIVGNIAWNAGSKFQDLLAWPVFIFTFFFAAIALSKLISHSRYKNGADTSSRLAGQLVLWSTPFYAGAGALLLGGSIENEVIAVSILGILFIGIVFVFHKENRTQLNPNLLGVAFFSILLISLVPVEIALLLGRAPMSLIGDINIGAFQDATYLLVGLGFVVGVFAFIRHGERLRQHLPKAISLGQLGLPLFFLTLYPARLLQPTGELTKYDTTIYLKILVVSLVVFGVCDVLHRYRVHSKAQNWKKLLSPLAIFGLLFVLIAGNTIPPHINPDDYHFGEGLLGWWSYTKGAIPYVGYIPPHGIIENDLRAFLATVFYDGSAASVADAGRIALAVLGFVAFLSIYYFTGSMIIAFIAVLMLGSRLTWFFLIPFICLWFSSSLRSNPAKWLAVWLLSSPVVILGVPPQGLLLVAASSILAFRQAWKQLFSTDRLSWIYIGSAILLLLLFFVVTPLFSMLIGAIRYVLENGPINQIAYGVPWSNSWASGAKSIFIIELVRMSWVLIPIVCLFVVYKNWRDYRNAQSVLYPAVAFLLFSLLLIPYSMGRVDVGSLSRPGLVSIFSWTVLLPLLLWNITRIGFRPCIVLIVALMSSILGYKFVSFNHIFSSASAKIHTGHLREAANAGLANIGNAYVRDANWDRITRLNELLKSELDSDETYLDLTSRNAHYFYLDREPPLSITAPYNLVSPSQQKRVVQNLDKPPKIALLMADNVIHDGGGLALRNPYLYRYVVDNYVPRFVEGFIVGYRKENHIDSSDSSITAEIKNLTDANWANGISRRDAAVILSDPFLVSMLSVGDQVRLENGDLRTISRVWVKGSAIWFDGEPLFTAKGEGRLSTQNSLSSIDIVSNQKVVREYTASLFYRSFSVSHYKKIPVAWGKSESSLKDRMTLVAKIDDAPSRFHSVSIDNGRYIVAGNDPQLVFDVSSFELSGRNSGLLKFDFYCSGKRADPVLQVFWWGGEREEPFEASSVRLTGETGTLIIPLDASPWWLLSENIRGIRIDLDNANSCRAFNVEELGLYRRTF